MPAATCNKCGKGGIAPKDMANHNAKCGKGGGQASRGAGGGRNGRPKSVVKVARATSKPQFVGGSRNILKDRLPTDLERYALRALHPCDDTLAGGERIPDMSNQETCALEPRAWAVVSAPVGLDAGKLWDCVVIYPNLPDVAAVVLVCETGHSFPDKGTLMPYRTPTGITSVDPGQPVVVNGSYWLPFPSLQVPYGSNNANEGSLKTQTMLSQSASDYRAVFKGATVVFNAATLSDQGMLFAGQWLQEPDKMETTPDTLSPQSFLAYGNLPLSEDSLYSKLSDLVQMRAREGCYMPFKYAQPYHSYVNGGGAGSVDWAVFGATRFTLSQTHLVLGSIDSADETKGSRVAVSAPVNVNVGVMLFRGMAATTTLDIKLRQGLEVIPSPYGPWGSFIETGPIPDTALVEKVVGIQRELALAYPERYNSLGGLLALVGPLVGKLGAWALPKIASWIRGKEGAAAAAVTQGMRLASDFVGTQYR